MTERTNEELADWTNVRLASALWMASKSPVVREAARRLLEQHGVVIEENATLVVQVGAQGELQRCETTETPRLPRDCCTCGDESDGMGPCPYWELGGNGRCVYCDHKKACHPFVSEQSALGTEDEVNPHLITAGKDRDGCFIYPFLDCDELTADAPAGKFLLEHEFTGEQGERIEGPTWQYCHDASAAFERIRKNHVGIRRLRTRRGTCTRFILHPQEPDDG